MPLLRAAQTLLELESGSLTSAQLDARLADPGQYSDWQVMCNMEKQVERMLDRDTMYITLGSKRAWDALASAQVPRVYAPDILSTIAPNAWAVYVPTISHIATDPGGSGVTQWMNALGVPARNLTASSTAQRPTLTFGATSIPRQPVLTFDGSSRYMRCASAFSQSTAYTIFMVYRRTGPVNTADGLIGSGSGVSTSQGFYSFNDGPGSIRSINMDATSPFTNAAPASGSWGMSRFRRPNASTLYHSANGGPESDTIAQGALAIPSFTTNPLDIGRCWSYFMTGNIAEIWLIAGNGDAASDEIMRVTAMLKVKYGI